MNICINDKKRNGNTKNTNSLFLLILKRMALIAANPAIKVDINIEEKKFLLFNINIHTNSRIIIIIRSGTKFRLFLKSHKSAITTSDKNTPIIKNIIISDSNHISFFKFEYILSL